MLHVYNFHYLNGTQLNLSEETDTPFHETALKSPALRGDSEELQVPQQFLYSSTQFRP